MADKYQQFKKFQLFIEEFVFISTLYEFLNEKNELPNLFNEHLQFEISYSYFKKNFLRKLEHYAANSCGVVCYKSDNPCDGHRTLHIFKNMKNLCCIMLKKGTFFIKISVLSKMEKIQTR